MNSIINVFRVYTACSTKSCLFVQICTSTKWVLKFVLAIKLILRNAKARYIISSMFWETQRVRLQINTNTRLLHGRQIQAASTNLTRRKEQQQTTISLRNHQPRRRRQRAVCCWPSCRLVSHNSIFINQSDNFNCIRNWCSNKWISPAVYMYVASKVGV